MKYNVYSLKTSDDYEKIPYGYAESPDSVDNLWVYQGEPLKADEEDQTWNKPTFIIEYGEFPDYLDNDCGWPIISLKMMEAIKKYANNSGDIKWYPILIKNVKVEMQYYVALIDHFKNFEEIVDYSKSRKLKNGKVYLPHFKYDLVDNFDVFVLESYNSSLFISNKLKLQLESENFKGLGFEDWYAS